MLYFQWIKVALPMGALAVLHFTIHEQTQWNQVYHYENMPIQIYWKFYHQKMKIFR